jgi:hypothetical protein
MMGRAATLTAFDKIGRRARGRWGLMGAAAFALAAHPASAQLQLPGAFTPAPAGASVAPAASAPAKPKPKKVGPPPPPRVISEENLVGRTLALNGRSGALELRKDGKGVVVSRLKLAGELISRRDEACEVDIGGPLALKPEGKPAGANRFAIDLPACPFSIDVLDGAAFAVGGSEVCEFKAADCKVRPLGLWGQPASEIGANRTREIERDRAHADTQLRARYRDWIKAAGKDRVLVQRIAREQVAFPGQREDACRAYARETQHGYCALQLTQARSLAAAARILPPEPPADDEPKKPSRSR